MALRDNIIAKEYPLDSNCEIVACEVFPHNSTSIIVCSFYRPPTTDAVYLQELCSLFEELTKNNPNTPIWLSGDINLPNIDWDHCTVQGSNYPLLICDIILDFLMNYGFVQMVDTPTRGNNILDVFFTNRPSLVVSCNVLPGISDHEIVHVLSTVSATHKRPSVRKIICWHKANYDLIKEYIIEFTNYFMNKYTYSSSIDMLWNEYQTLCETCINLVPCRVTSTRFGPPWLTNDIKRLSKKKQRWYNIARSTNLERDWALYQKLKKEMQQTCHKSYNGYLSTLLDRNNNCTKRFWSFIKSKRKDQMGINVLQSQGISYTDSVAKANILNKQFSSVFTREDLSSIPAISGEPIPDIPPLHIEVEGVKHLLENLDPHKAMGPDNIPSKLLKETASLMAPLLAFIYQSSLHQGKLPAEWKHANVIPIYKKGSRKCAANYRPISLTSICCKTLEHIIHSFIFTHIDKYNILCDHQHGFRKHRSSETQLIATSNDFLTCLNSGEHTDALFLDFAKAFDKVPHKRLCQKLSHYGITGSILSWIVDFLCNRSQNVLLEGQHSVSCPVLSGVPQGTVLGPLLFLLYINDIPDSILSTLRLYADDILLYSTIHSISDCKRLQQDLATLEKWASLWQMEFNLNKCEHLPITNKKSSISYDYQLCGQTIQKVSSVKYLGVTFDQHLTWKAHINNLCSRANLTKAFLQRNISHCPVGVKSRCYQSFVRSIIEYSAPVWSPYTKCDILRLEKIQRSAARYVLNDYSYLSSVSAMIHQLNWPTLELRRNYLKLIMLYKIAKGLVDITSVILTPLQSETRGHRYRFRIPSARINSYLYSFLPSTIKLWNNLPQHLVELSTLEQFKTQLLIYLYPVAT